MSKATRIVPTGRSMAALVWMIGVFTATVAETDGAPPWVPTIGSQQYFAVSVEDVDAAAVWYETALGLSRKDDTTAENGAWRILNLVNERLHVEIIRDDRDAAVERARGIAKVGFAVPDVRVVAERVGEATGEKPRVLPFPAHGIRLVQLRDPDGNIVQLFSPLEEEK